MGLLDEVRAGCAEIARQARHVRIDLDRADAIVPGAPPRLDPEHHFVEGTPAEVAAYVLTLDAINFGSGWFPTLRKRPGSSGYQTIAGALAERFRREGPWWAQQLAAIETAEIAGALGQAPEHELMELYTRALRELGAWLGDRTAADAVRAANGSAGRLVSQLAAGMPMFDDRGFWKRAQICANDLALAAVADFQDLDRLTIFADNVVPHVLRVDGVLVYEPRLADRIDAGQPIEAGSLEEREIRGCAVHACEVIASELGVAPRVLDTWLWERGQDARYKAVPRHRTRTVNY
jgi:hypothetical protein